MKKALSRFEKSHDCRHDGLMMPAKNDLLKFYMPSQRLSAYFKDYGSYHRTEGNKLCHFIGIPMIMVALLGLLAQLSLGPVGGGISILDPDYFRYDGGTALILLATLWYLYLDWRIAFPFSFVALGFYFIAQALPVAGLWIFFVVGWIFQLVGHSVYEKNRPAFLKNFEHLLIGPLWIFARLVKYS